MEKYLFTEFVISIKWWERLLLVFARKRLTECEGYGFFYKKMFGKVYVIKDFEQ